MPRYIMERTVGEATREELDRIAARSQQIREDQFPEITWEHTHVAHGPKGLKAFCVYESPNPESVKAHAIAVGLPVEFLYEIETDLAP